jgi:uncharacterized protein involved in outer membrane biogenesis
MKKIIWGLVGVIVVAGFIASIVLYLSLGRVIKTGVEKLGPEMTQTQVQLGDVRVSPLSGRVELKNVLFGNPQGFETDSLFRLDRMLVRLAPASVFSDTIHIQEILIRAPEFTYEVSLNGSNINQLKKNVESYVGGAMEGAGKSAAKPGADSAGPAKKVQVDKFLLTAGQVHFSIKGLGGQKVTLPLPEIKLENLGQGRPMGEVIQEIVQAVTEAITSTVSNTNAIMPKAEELKKTGQALENQAKDLLKGFKSLAPKK